jgi:hypothetical protein
VLRGETRGYRHHPQLIRFQSQASQTGAIAAYLRVIHEESVARGYRFQRGKVGRASLAIARDATRPGRRARPGTRTVTRGQLQYEWDHLMAKLAVRDPGWRKGLATISRPRPHPLFCVIPGGVEEWER